MYTIKKKVLVCVRCCRRVSQAHNHREQRKVVLEFSKSSIQRDDKANKIATKFLDVRRTVWVKHVGGKPHTWWLFRVVLSKGDAKGEYPPLPRRFIWSEDGCVPDEEVVIRVRACTASLFYRLLC